MAIPLKVTTKCRGGTCPLKENCFRFTSSEEKKTGLILGIPYDKRKQTCDFYIPNTTEPPLTERAKQ